MLDTTSLQIRKVQEQRNELLLEYIRTKDPEILKEIENLDNREKLLLTKHIIER